jgi:hypothetical protein
MTFLTDLFSHVKADEAFVLSLVVKIKAEVQIIEADAQKAMQWLDANAGTVAQNIANVTAVVIKLGLVAHPEIGAAVTAANIAVAALNAFAAAVAAGTPNTTAIVDGYNAVKQAQVAQATAALAVATNAPAKAA